jgi:hypothetical protein
MALEATAVLTSGLFAGVAVYVALIARASWLRAMRSNVSVAIGVRRGGDGVLDQLVDADERR